jgi:hypothetical protein
VIHWQRFLVLLGAFVMEVAIGYLLLGVAIGGGLRWLWRRLHHR